MWPLNYLKSTFIRYLSRSIFSRTVSDCLIFGFLLPEPAPLALASRPWPRVFVRKFGGMTRLTTASFNVYFLRLVPPKGSFGHRAGIIPKFRNAVVRHLCHLLDPRWRPSLSGCSALCCTYRLIGSEVNYPAVSAFIHRVQVRLTQIIITCCSHRKL